jgi:hypothetical protein
MRHERETASGNCIATDMLHRHTEEEDISPAETLSFHRIAYGVARAVPEDHRTMLIDMGLAHLDDLGIPVLTEAGWKRYERETAGRVRAV